MFSVVASPLIDLCLVLKPLLLKNKRVFENVDVNNNNNNEDLSYQVMLLGLERPVVSEVTKFPISSVLSRHLA